MLERCSALPTAEARAARRDSPSLIIGEVRGFALLQAAAFVGTLAALERALRSATGAALPTHAGVPSHAGALCVFKVGPELFWIVGPQEAPGASVANHGLGSNGSEVARLDANTRLYKIGPEQVQRVGAQETWATNLREAVPPEMGSVTGLSHARTRLFIEGTSAREVLSRGIALDLHPEVFKVDACALTGLESTPVLLHRTGLHRYELYVLRTYAEWIWEWLTDAALPFEYEVAGKSHRAISGDSEPL